MATTTTTERGSDRTADFQVGESVHIKSRYSDGNPMPAEVLEVKEDYVKLRYQPNHGFWPVKGKFTRDRVIQSE